MPDVVILLAFGLFLLSTGLGATHALDRVHIASRHPNWTVRGTRVLVAYSRASRVQALQSCFPERGQRVEVQAVSALREP
jgi:hypothetical protein